MAFPLKPDKCIVVDVSFALQAFVSEENKGLLNGGPMIGIGAPLDQEMSQALCRLAKERKIPFQREAYAGSTGTDADRIAVSGEGVRCSLLSIPLRNMHTQVETIALEDIENTARLICAYMEESEGAIVP